MDFIQQIKDEMNRQGLTGRQLAIKTGVSETTVYRWFRNEGDPNTTSLIDAAWALGMEWKLVPKEGK